MKEENESYIRRGEILALAISTEDMLDDFISNYFCFPLYYRYTILKDTILIRRLNFASKIEIFKEICEREGIVKTELLAIVKELNWMRDKRNKVAHNPFIVFKEETGERIFAISKKSTEFKEDEILEVTEDLVEEFRCCNRNTSKDMLAIKQKIFGFGFEKQVRELEEMLEKIKKVKPYG